MAILKPGSTVGGNLILHQGMLPLYPDKDSIYYKNFKIYSEKDKPTPVELNVYDKTQVNKQTIQGGNNAGLYTWIKVGTIKLPQFGRTITMRVSGGPGYNGIESQNSDCLIVIRTGNGSVTTNQTGRITASIRNFSSQSTTNIVGDFSVTETESDVYDIYMNLGSYSTNAIIQIVGESVQYIAENWTPIMAPITGEPPATNMNYSIETIYSTINKPNKVDVGLGNLSNDAQVKKAGDTMTGILTAPDVKIQSQGTTNESATRRDFVVGELNKKLNNSGAVNIRGSLSVASNGAVSDFSEDSVMIGDSDTGFVSRSDGILSAFANHSMIYTIRPNATVFHKSANFQYASGSDQDAVEMPPLNESLINISTSVDNNGQGGSHIGRNENGKFSHYLRGRGKTNIETHEGLFVAEKLQVNGVIERDYKRRGEYDSTSLIRTWSEVSENRLRKMTRGSSDRWYHEILDTGGLRWAHGGDDALTTFFRLTEERDGEIILGNPNGVQSTYRSDGNIIGPTFGNLKVYVDSHVKKAGDTMTGLLIANGGIEINTDTLIKFHRDTDFATIGMRGDNASMRMEFDLGDDGDEFFRFRNAQNPVLLDINKSGLYLQKDRWQDMWFTSFIEQWNTVAPFQVVMNDVLGDSNYYPAFRQKTWIREHGHVTRVELGTLRSANTWGQGVISVGSSESHNPEIQYNYMFDIFGKMTTSKLYATSSLLVGTGDSALGDKSITLGDSDTGIKWNSDGVWTLWANNTQMCVIDRGGANFRTEGGIALISYGDLNQASDAHSTYVRDIYIRSDIRVKKDLELFKTPSQTLRKINGYLYQQKKGFKEDGSINWEQSSGLIAQEVQAVLPELISVDKEGEGLLRLNYNGIIALNTSVLNEHTDEISELKARISELEKLLGV